MSSMYTKDNRQLTLSSGGRRVRPAKVKACLDVVMSWSNTEKYALAASPLHAPHHVGFMLQKQLLCAGIEPDKGALHGRGVHLVRVVTPGAAQYASGVHHLAGHNAPWPVSRCAPGHRPSDIVAAARARCPRPPLAPARENVRIP